MNAKKVCCLVTVTAMLFFGLPAVPFANVDRASQLSQEELGLVFQHSGGTWNEKPDFLKYLDDQEMKETKGKAAPILAYPATGFALGVLGSVASDIAQGNSISLSNALAAGVGGAWAFSVGRLSALGGLGNLSSGTAGGLAGIVGTAGTHSGLNSLSSSGGCASHCHENKTSL